MKQRCYSALFHQRRPSYIGCVVCDEWLVFENFYYWVVNQDWKGKHLDKDILIPNNKIYSPDTCVFVSPKLNRLLTQKNQIKDIYQLVFILIKTEDFLLRQYLSMGK